MPEGIAYQNKDIEFKLLNETFKEKSFEAYGLDLPRIKSRMKKFFRESGAKRRIGNGLRSRSL